MKTRMNFIVGLILTLAFFSVAVTAQDVEAVSKPVRVNFKPKDTTAPTIFLSYKEHGVVNKNGNVEVEVRIMDESGIASIFINDEKQELVGARDSLMLALSFKPEEEVSIKVKDQFNNEKDKSFVIKGQAVVISTVAAEIKHRYYALLIGVQQYEDPAINSLTEPIKDARLLRKVLTEKYTFEPQDITLLENPNYEKMNVALEELSTKVTPNDFLLIFYAGHGYYDENSKAGFWLPSDAQKKSKSKWFRNSALVENMGAINSKHTLLIADACFSGGIFKTRAAFNNANMDISYMLKTPSRKAITSGSLTTVPDKSVFMKFLLKILNENENKYLPTEMLFDKLKSIVMNNSETTPMYGEIKNIGDEGGNFVFVAK